MTPRWSARGSERRGLKVSIAIPVSIAGSGVTGRLGGPIVPAGRFPLWTALQRPQDEGGVSLETARRKRTCGKFLGRHRPDNVGVHAYASSRAGEPERTTVTLALAGPAIRRGSAPVTCESAARTAPP